MLLIRFPNTEAKRAALGALAGRFSFKSWSSGDMIVPADALAFLTARGIAFSIEGPDTDKQSASS